MKERTEKKKDMLRKRVIAARSPHPNVALILFLAMIAFVSGTSDRLRFFAETQEQVDAMVRLGLHKSCSPGVFEGDSSHLSSVRDLGVSSQSEPHPSLTFADPFAGYSSAVQLSSQLEALVQQTGGQLYTVGRSVRGVTLEAVRLGPKKPAAARVLFMGGIHGDEAVGAELVLAFGRHLINADSTETMQDMEIYLLPRMNPDGFASVTRTNANGVDLNRNFPDQYMGEDAEDSGRNRASAVRQKETQHIMDFVQLIRPHLMVALHGGSTVCNYPFDGNREHHNEEYTDGPDDKLFKEVCMAWADLNPEMAENRLFDHGITNGAAWYILYGGLQDWAYINLGVISVTTEVSRVKWPDGRSVISRYGPNNLAAMVAFARTTRQSISGRVMHDTLPVANASIRVTTRDSTGDRELMEVKTDANGYYVRLLPVSSGTIIVAAPHYIGIRIEYVMTKDISLRRDFYLVNAN